MMDQRVDKIDGWTGWMDEWMNNISNKQKTHQRRGEEKRKRKKGF